MDNTLSTFTPTYSVANRNGSGFDGIAYPTIAAAMVAASTGQTIYLRGATYTELSTFATNRQCCLWINKGVRIKPYNHENVVITYGTIPTYDTVDYGPIVYVSAAGATLEELTIIGTHAAGDSPGGGDLDCNVLVQNNQGITLEGCTLTDWGHCGAKTPIVGDITLTNCMIRDGGFTPRDHGYYGANSGTITISGCTFQNCAGYGIHLYGTPSGAVVQNCLITNNGTADVANQGGGILLDGNGHHQILGNTITNNKNYGGLVIYHALSVSNTINNNTITGNTMADVTLDNAVAPQTESGNVVGTYWTNTDYAAWPH